MYVFARAEKKQIPRRFAPRNDKYEFSGPQNDNGELDEASVGGRSVSDYGTQSAMKILVSCGALALRFDAQTSFFPSGLNMGKPSKPGL